MRLFARFRSWLRSLLNRSRTENDMNTELRSHIEAYADDLMRTGIPREEALRRARLEFGGIERVKEECRESRGIGLIESAMQDVRFAFRMLRKSPGFTAVTVLTLALGIGANTAIFSIINAVMLKALPVKDPNQLVLFQWDSDKWPPQFSMTGWRAEFAYSYPAFELFSEHDKSLASIFAFAPLDINEENASVGINGDATLANAMMVSGQFFSGLGVAPLLGRQITDADENPAAPRVAMISYAYWIRQFGHDSAILGRNISLNGVPFTVVGVAPRSFFGIEAGAEPDIWLPFDDKPNLRPWSRAPDVGASSFFTARNWQCLNIFGRLKNGVTKEQAQAEFDSLFRQFVTKDWRPDRADQVPRLTLAQGSQGLPHLQRNTDQPLYVLMVAVGLILLIACANVATLLLARATSRKEEVGVRLALGASRSRLIRQLLTESVLMSILGGALGLVFAQWGTRALVALLPNGGTRIILDAGADTKVLLFTLAAAILTGILFGLAPAFRVTRFELASVMRASASNLTDGRDKHRLGNSLIVAQVAASLVLMIGAGLFVRTLVNFENKNFGFDQRNLLSFGLDPTRDGYHDARLVNLYSQILDRIREVPGVQAATLIQDPPLSGWQSSNNITVEGVTRPADSEVRWLRVAPDFFRTLGTPLLYGRGILPTDTASSPAVAVVDQPFVNKFFAGQNPIGHRFSAGLTFDPAKAVEIVGVVKRAQLTYTHSETDPRAYLSYAQAAGDLNEMYFEVRTQGPPAGVIPRLRDAVGAIDSRLPLMDLKTQSQQTSEALSQENLFARLTTVFGLLALLLAMIGLYGTMAYSVTRKTHEIGIRMALGAKRTDVLSMVIWQGVTLTLIGVVLGVVIALGATRLISTMIFGVTPYDPVTFLVVAAVLIAVALLACWIPARRATKVDPIVALRYE